MLLTMFTAVCELMMQGFKVNDCTDQDKSKVESSQQPGERGGFSKAAVLEMLTIPHRLSLGYPRLHRTLAPTGP